MTMTDTKFILVPGLVDQPAPLTTQREYWYLRCPACGEAHERTVTQYWSDALGSDEVSGIVTRHCFICAEHGIHYRIDPKFPFAITHEIKYRPEKVERHDDEGDKYEPPF